MSMARARRRDRRVYLASHPVVLALLAVTRRWPVLRLGRLVLVHGAEAFEDALARVPLDRLAAGTTGATAREYLPDGLLFDQEGPEHRGARRSLADNLGPVGVDLMRPLWNDVLARRLRVLAQRGTVDVVDLAVELAGATTCAILDIDADPRLVARAALDSAATGARRHLPGLRWPTAVRAADQATARAVARLTDQLGTGTQEPGSAAMLAVAAVATTVASLPRAVAWCCDARLWNDAVDDGRRPALVDELLRVLAPTPVLRRSVAADATMAGCPVRRGDQLLLVARHAVGAHRIDPDSARPVPPRVARLVFGTGPHVCPGARLARTQLADTLRAMAAYEPVVVRSRADRRSALPGWRSLLIRSA